jgi:hypothetical protein
VPSLDVIGEKFNLSGSLSKYRDVELGYLCSTKSLLRFPYPINPK